MKIGIDIDSTVADAMPVFLKWIEHRHGLDLVKEDITRWHMSWGDVVLYNEICWVLSDPEKIMEIPLIGGAKEGVEYLRKDNDIIFITSRLQETRESTRKWVDKYFGDVEVFHTDADKNGFKVEILIDDAPHQIERFVTRGGYGIVFNQPWNQIIKPDAVATDRVFRANNWEEVLYIVEMIRLTKLINGGCASCSKKCYSN